MSSVSSAGTDSGLGNYYHKSLRELQDQIEAESKRNQELRKEEVDALDKSYKKALTRKDEEADDAIKNVRKATNEALDNQRAKHEASLDELKDQYLSSRREGSMPGQESGLGNYYHKTLKDLEKVVQEEAEKNRASQSGEIEKLEAAHRNTLLRQERDSSETVRNARAYASEEVGREREKQQAEIDRIKNLTYNALGQVPGSVSPEVHKKQVQDLYDLADARHKKDLETVETVENDYRQRLRARDQENDNEIRDVTHAHVQEVRDLDDRIKTLNAYNRTLDKHGAEAEDKRIRENENSSRAEYSRLNEAFNADTGKLKQNLKEVESDMGRRHSEALKEKDTHFAKVISSQNSDTQSRVANLDKEFTTQLNAKEQQRLHDEKLSADRTEALLNRANTARQNALEQQANNYQETFQRTRDTYDQQITSLENTLQKQKTSEDSTLISPAADAAIRKSVTDSYEKTLNTEIERNKRATDHIQRKYIDQYKRALEENADRETDIHRTNAQEKSNDRSIYLDSVRETEYVADEKVRSQEVDHDRERENLFRQFGTLLERQRRDYENILERSKSDSREKMQAVRLDFDSRMKDTHRILNTRNTDLIREYDKKLADQRADSDLKFEDFRAQSSLDLRETERRTKVEAETQSKAYELRIAQLEAQNKERERYLAQNFQDEVDKIRRSYELLNKKKS